ncbi:MAG: DUF4147 domain-containing protein [Saprospiraceae bacterium]|nr:DUF4147 domain-containing protein [Saprospiraceae bacterium]
MTLFHRDGLAILNEGIEAVKPNVFTHEHVNVLDNTLIICDKHYILNHNILKVIALGKAAAEMVMAIKKSCDTLLVEGICITKYGHGFPIEGFESVEAAHPIPDENSVLAFQKIDKFCHKLKADDTVMVLLSGGASALVMDLPFGTTLAEMQEVNDRLLKSGADIHEINTVRKKLSVFKGGGLKKALGHHKLITIVLSDVIGDDPSIIGSGPTVGDTSTFKNAYDILIKYNIWYKLPNHTQHTIADGMIIESASEKQEKVQPELSDYYILANNKMALSAAKEKATNLGYKTDIMEMDISCTVTDFVHSICYHILTCKDTLPACLIWGGEPTLEVMGTGKGGRNQHLVLCVLAELVKTPLKYDVMIVSAGTDGTDGPTDAAGAYIDSLLIDRVALENIDMQSYMYNFDAYHFFEKYGSLIKTGPTGTNVMDMVIVLVRAK